MHYYHKIGKQEPTEKKYASRNKMSVAGFVG